MKNQTSADFSKVDRDPRLFMAFLTLVVSVMYVFTLVTVPEVRQPIVFILFTLLIVLHLSLHLFLEKISEQDSSWVTGYLIVQGLLAFAISMIAGTVGMTFALFMGMIGESVGLLGIKRRGLLALAYFLTLSMVSFANFVRIDSIGWWALGTVPIVLFVVIYVTMYMRQIEARAQAQALAVELENANQQLSEYVDRVEDLTIANERQRMARELHDTLSQGLAGLILQLEAADANLANERSDRARVIIQQSMQQARATLEDSRRAIDNLRQSEPESLEDAIHREVTQFSEYSGIPCEMRLEIPGRYLEEIQEAVIRSVSEALNNIARHAAAQKVEISALSENGSLRLILKDYGKGFDPENIPAGHYGILGIRERIRLVGGQLEITSSSQSGTTLIFTIPVNDEEE
jgi:NarL family two-component system sensor histidine kinase YdfH